MEQGASVAFTGFQFASRTAMCGSEVVLGSGAATNLTSFAWLRNRDGLSKNTGFEAAAPRPTRARVKFGNGQMETAKHAADAPIVLAGKAGVLGKSSAEQNTPDLLSKNGMEPVGGD